MNSSENPVEMCQHCVKEEAVRLDDAYGIPVYGFCSSECAIQHGYRPEVFSGDYETDGDAVEPS